jgi:thioredoxin reductase
VSRALAWGAGIAGVLAAVFLRRRRAVPSLADPAAELRRKLEATRSVPVEVSIPEPPAAPDATARRREVHEDARAAIDEMRREKE